MPMVSNHMPHSSSDCCCRSSWKRGRRGPARASIPRSASGRSQETWLPSDTWKRRSGPAPPVSKSPRGAPCCCPVGFFPKLVGPPFPFVKGVPALVELPLLLVDEVLFALLFRGSPPLNPPLPPNIPPMRRSMPL